jgi:DNA-3-methyladenine glycosylase II
MQRITAEISATDKRFAKVISESPLCSIGSSASPESNFQSLVSSVISQQLAVKAAETIHGRLNQLAKGQITPVRIAKLTDAALREIGVSGAKAKTIRGLAQASLTGSVPIENLHERRRARCLRIGQHHQLVKPRLRAFGNGARIFGPHH